MLKQYGKENAKVVFISGHPTDEEIQSGESFTELDRMHLEFLCERGGIDIDDVMVVNCYDKKYKVSKEELQKYYRSNILPKINEYDRKVVIPLGLDAVAGVGLEGFTKLSEIKGLVHKVDGNNVVVSNNPYFLRMFPDDIEDVEKDLALVRRVIKGETSEEHPIDIRTLDTLDDFSKFVDKCTLVHGTRIAYDIEATDKTQDTALMVSVAFCLGEKNNDGSYIVYYWRGYDKLIPAYDSDTMSRFKEQFIRLFQHKNTEFIGWNTTYDDWVIESNLNITFKQSAYDGMEMKWVCDKDGAHGLKDCTARYQGYFDYEGAIKSDLQGIKSRRNRRLCEEDLRVLEFAGVEPEVSKTGLLKWNTELDKGFAMYALLDPEKLKLYNCLDALFTFKNFEHFENIINSDERLVSSLALRRRIGKEFMRCQQFGLLLDCDMNRAYSNECAVVAGECESKLNTWIAENEPDFAGMNYYSNPQLVTLLFGKPIKLPFVVPELGGRKMWNKENTQAFHSGIYGDYSAFAKLEPGAVINTEKIEQFVRLQAVKTDPRFTMENITIEYRNVYCSGRYKPTMFSKKTGLPSCGIAALQVIAQGDADNPFITLLLMLRKASKIKSTFLDGIYKLRTKLNTVHPRLNQVGTETGRGSSSKFNSQNLIKYIRGQFTARPGNLILDLDLSQAEIRALAAESGDQNLIEAAKGDLHTAIAKRIFPDTEITYELRQQSKTTVFAIIYGISDENLAIGIRSTLDRAIELKKFFEIAFPDAAKWMKKQVEELRNGKHKYYVYTAFGTRRLVRSILSIDASTRSHAERIAMNSPIQGDAGEYTFWLITEAADRLRREGIYDKCRMFNTTHDSISSDISPELLEVAMDDEGNPITKNGCDYELKGGYIYDLYKNLVENPAPVYPLNTVVFRADFEVRNRWSCKPNLLKALDPKSEIFNWDLIKGDKILDDEEGELVIAVA